MALAEANQLLGGPHATEAAIKAAYAKMVRAIHPDTLDPLSGLPAGVTIGQLQTARDVLLAGLNQGQEITCKLCGGSGRVAGSFGTPCAVCKGKGIVNG